MVSYLNLIVMTQQAETQVCTKMMMMMVPSLTVNQVNSREENFLIAIYIKGL